MWTRIYVGVLAAAVLVVAFFTYYSWSWLQSIGAPADAVAGFGYHDGLGWTTLFVTTLVLIAIGNVVFWVETRAWALWATFAYFAVFIATKSFWLGPSSFAFRHEVGLATGTFSGAPILGSLMIIVAGVLVFADHFLAIRLRRKMYPAAPTTSSSEADVIPPQLTPRGDAPAGAPTAGGEPDSAPPL